MPIKILELLKIGSLTEWQISEKLNISVDEVNACIEYLYHAGAIKPTIMSPNQTSCSGKCNKCSSSCNTCSGSSYKVWEIV